MDCEDNKKSKKTKILMESEILCFYIEIDSHTGILNTKSTEGTMKRSRFVGGIFLLVLAAVIFLFTDAPVPVRISLTVVGIALVAVSKKK